MAIIVVVVGVVVVIVAMAQSGGQSPDHRLGQSCSHSPHIKSALLTCEKNENTPESVILRRSVGVVVAVAVLWWSSWSWLWVWPPL